MSYKVNLEMKVHNCNRCEYEWAGKLEVPKTCANPKCRTPYWNKPRKRDQSRIKNSQVEKFHFWIETQYPSKTYSFSIIRNKIICEECNDETCYHVFDIIADPHIRERIANQGIVFSTKYENEIKERGKNIQALKEFVEKTAT